MALNFKGQQWGAWQRPRDKFASLRYPWHLWLNGDLWFLIRGVDFDSSVRDMQRKIWVVATSWGIRYRTEQDEFKRGLWIKATANTTRQGLHRSKHFRAMERVHRQRAEEDPDYDYPEVLEHTILEDPLLKLMEQQGIDIDALYGATDAVLAEDERDNPDEYREDD